MPASLARWQAQGLSHSRSSRPWPARWARTAGSGWPGGGPACGVTVSLYAGDVAVGWRCFTDRSVPSRFRLSEVLMVESIRHACESGCRYIEMGESCGKDTLASIKARLGGQEHPLAEYCFERLPLSSGRMAYQRFAAWRRSITGHAR